MKKKIGGGGGVLIFLPVIFEQMFMSWTLLKAMLFFAC